MNTQVNEYRMLPIGGFLFVTYLQKNNSITKPKPGRGKSCIFFLVLFFSGHFYGALLPPCYLFPCFLQGSLNSLTQQENSSFLLAYLLSRGR